MSGILQNNEIERVGGVNPIQLKIRVIAATHRNLEEMVKAARFRQDLWFRLNVFPIYIPPLRKRKCDIPDLVDHFLKTKSIAMGLREVPKLAPGELDKLMSYDWPGNVRELENLVERALILNNGNPIEFIGFNAKQTNQGKLGTRGGESDTQLNLDNVVATHIEHVLSITKGKLSGPGGAAELLGVNASTLRNKMIRLNLPFKKQKNL